MKKIITLLYLLLVIPIYSQWIPLNSGTTEMLNDVYCITQDIVVVVGNNGTILKTTDGGTIWIQKTSGISSHLLKVQFPTTTIGYAVGSSGVLLKTINQGETWSIINVNFTNDLYGLTCLTENIFFISGDNGLVRKTINGGSTFEEKNVITNQVVSDIQFLSELVGYAIVGSLDYFSSNKMLYKTTNGGNSWAILLNESVDAFYFLNESVGFINKTNNSLNKTIDGGLNLQSIGNSNLFESAIFSLNENQVWDTGATPLLCNCTFQCISKREIFQDTSFLQYDACNENYELIFPFLESIHFANETNGFAVGINGRILKNSNGINEYLSINTFSKKLNLTIYPNPAKSQVTVSLAEMASPSFEIEITNMLGKKVYSQSYQSINNVSIDTKAFSKGVYFLTVIQQEKMESQKIIID